MSFCLSLVFLVTGGVCLAAEDKTDGNRDVYLDREGLSAAEGLPYEYMIPAEEYVKTKVDPRYVYLGMEALYGAEGLPYEYMMDPDDYAPVKHLQGRRKPRL